MCSPPSADENAARQMNRVAFPKATRAVTGPRDSSPNPRDLGNKTRMGSGFSAIYGIGIMECSVEGIAPDVNTTDIPADPGCARHAVQLPPAWHPYPHRRARSELCYPNWK
jgi:hypothetical protein